MPIHPLPFDSDLFNYPVGKAVITKGWNERAFLDETADYQLVYIFSKYPIQFTTENIRWVDTKITYQKDLAEVTKIGDIMPYKGELLPEIVDLAYLSGSHSRFKTDSRLQNDEFLKLYKLWIQKAFEANQILIAPDLAGMVTFTLKKEQGAVGLISVAEVFQGKGWGKKLVKAAEYMCQKEGAKEMLIPTQETNRAACKLYESLHYRAADKVYVYHWYKS